MKKIKGAGMGRIWFFLLILAAMAVCCVLFYQPHILVTIESDRECEFMVYYDNGNREEYCFDDSHMSVTYILQKGVQTVNVDIPRRGMDRLRFDFGNNPCNVAIYEIVLKPYLSNVRILSAEKIFASFDELNDIEKNYLADEQVRYAVSGGDGYIASSNDITEYKKATVYIDLVKYSVLCVVIALLLTYNDLVRVVLNKIYSTYRTNRTIANSILAITFFEVSWVSICPQYWLLETPFAVIFGCAVCFLMNYLMDNKFTFKEYTVLIMASTIAMLPLFLTDFYYGDTYWARVPDLAASSAIGNCIAAQRPIVALIELLSPWRKVMETSNIARIAVGLVFIVCALLMYRFTLEKTNNNLFALLVAAFLCVSIPAIDCISYLAVWPISFSVLFSMIAYLAWERCIQSLKNGTYKDCALYGIFYAGTLLTAFCVYQIGTPIIFVMLVISVLNEKDENVIKKGFSTVFAYGIVAIGYLVITSWLQSYYGVSKTQEARSAFINTLPQIVGKIEWFVFEVIPQSVHRLWVNVLPRKLYKTGNMFYAIHYQSTQIKYFTVVLVLSVILFYLLRRLYCKEWQKFVGYLCAFPLCFYPFLLLPESTVLTYYLLPLILLILVLFLQGLLELIALVKEKMNNRNASYRIDSILMYVIIIIMAANSTLYANHWVNYSRDSFQYMKQFILSSNYENTRWIHVYGNMSPYVGDAPYIIHAIKGILEDEGIDPEQYTITQSANSYYLTQLTADDASKLKDRLTSQEYAEFMKWYIYSEYYDCYYLSTYSIPQKNLEYLQTCLRSVGLMPAENSESIIVISLEGFNRTHSF